MRVKDFLDSYPRIEGENVEEYVNRLLERMKEQNFESTFAYVRKLYFDTKRLVLREQKKDGAGNVISSRHVNEYPIDDLPENLEIDRVTHYTPTGAKWVKYKSKNSEEELDKKAALEYLSSLPKPEKRVFRYKANGQKTALIVVITDVHIGMAPNPREYAIFKHKWAQEDIMAFVDNIISEVLREYKDEQDILVLDLGDFMDGYENKTTRGGHHLPQNMNSREAMKVGSEFKLSLLDGIQQATKANVIAHSLCNDNHAGTYGWIVNHHAKVLCENANKRIMCNVHEQFITHFNYLDKTFILCHGKDESEQKFSPFTVPIGKKGEKIIRDYISVNNIQGHVYFLKGDSHIMHVDMYSMSGIDYFSFLPMCPPSYWAGSNFGMGRQGYAILKLEEGKKSISVKVCEH